MRANLIYTIRSHRVATLILVDAVAWLIAVYVAAVLRLETVMTAPVWFVKDAQGAVPLYGALVVAGAAVVLHTALAWVTRLHHGRSALGSFEEIFTLVSVVSIAGAFLTAANTVAPNAYIARTTPAAAACLALLLCAWPRGLWRILVSQAKPNRFGVVPVPVLIVGAGDSGRQLVQSMQRDSRQNWNPVGFIDDDKRKKHFRYRGVAVIDKIDDLALAATKVSVDTVVIAMPSADSALLNRINGIARAAGLKVKVLPGVDELLTGIEHTAVRDIEPADLLGRHQIETDLHSIAGYLTGKRVLVTGAGGSIGSELCRQVSLFGPADLIMLDRDESALHALMLSIYGRADLESPNVVLADIRDPGRMQDIFQALKPDVVFHAAALKHVNMLERHPAEAVKTNVAGTVHLLDAAAAVGVERFVNISTDKAADPENVLGYTKRIAEGLTASFAASGEGVYLSVRFGNVLGTRGSVLTTFASQINQGGPVTVTDPNVTRFFMTIGEAVQLVIQAAAIGRDGEALVLDMGEPVRIVDVAHQLIEQSNESIDIVYTGLKPGEKLHEVLLGVGEVDHRPVHPLVSHVSIVPVSRETALKMPQGHDNQRVIDGMKLLCFSMQNTLARDSSR